jgi:hypothetical protein
MKVMRIFIMLCIVTVVSCTPPVVFDQAYPSDKENLKSIPKQYQGAFICESDSALVVITDHIITLHREHFFNTKIKYVEEREECKIVDDKMYVSGRLECIPITMVNDSMVRGTFQETDTLFFMEKGSVARLYKGHLVINQEIKHKEWAISLLSPENGGDITYKAITEKTKIKNVSKVTHTTEITVNKGKKPRYKIRPTMKEFDELLTDDKVFIECDYLTRVNMEGLFLN